MPTEKQPDAGWIYVNKFVRGLRNDYKIEHDFYERKLEIKNYDANYVFWWITYNWLYI